MFSIRVCFTCYRPMISFQWIPGPLSMIDSMICLHIPSSKLLSISFCSYLVRPPGFYFYSSAEWLRYKGWPAVFTAVAGPCTYWGAGCDLTIWAWLPNFLFRGDSFFPGSASVTGLPVLHISAFWTQSWTRAFSASTNIGSSYVSACILAKPSPQAT